MATLALLTDRSAGVGNGPEALMEKKEVGVGSLEIMEPAASAKVEANTKASEAETIQPLPLPPANLAGSSSVSGRNFHLTVSNKAGYLCHVHVDGNWPVAPEVPFAIFTHPDNSALFRDVKRVGARHVLKTEPRYKEVQVEQLGDVRILWIHRTYSTWLHVIEDARDPENLRITFDLVKSDVLGKFSGRWDLRPIRDPATGQVVGCHGELNQDVLPKGMPSFMSRMPLLGGALRGISVRAVTRVMDDFNMAVEKVLAGHATGRTTEAILRELCGPASEVAHANGAVNSFAFDLAEGEVEDEDECASEDAAKAHARAELQTGGEPCTATMEAVTPLPAVEEALRPDIKTGTVEEVSVRPAKVSAATDGMDENIEAVTVVPISAVGSN
ncbi:hypothetical protein Vretimale_1315 [Volvox reticuliferus]|uniref:Coenzyme Q-binding protein COQ10 START domain-containing protein n=1 Tax=Volvox reticuliferus TaxID=1737510 RepID=A0A8J4D591_9CHLO|nr:hypothetical protein Vretifemale_10740 [Volvox reticuliferus]GIL95290.1 hypothetical protein Vretimale_1315 [Volvox reticuliferus]